MSYNTGMMGGYGYPHAAREILHSVLRLTLTETR
jgi:hypothetical protein